MASQLGGAASGAVGGAATGAAIGGPYGAAIGAIGGGIYGALSTPDDYTSPSFSDINLANENPELYQNILQLRALQQQAQTAYNARRLGMTDQEQRDLSQGLSNSRDVQSSQGLLGSSVGNSQLADTNARLRGSIANRALQEQGQLYGQLQGATQNSYNATNQALQEIMAQKTGGAQLNYQQGLAQTQGNTQFIQSGLNSYQTANNNANNEAFRQQMLQNSPFYGQGGYGGPVYNSLPIANPSMSYNPYSSGTPGVSAQPSLGNYNYGSPNLNGYGAY